eukprot:MONOS_1789.1-p1 / transcript=MONOS_1789.1 / gene=MONOS_1789 / organism=Monocercomonoides_exilis_PA203 / gene_product=unspecified product / transcript_product=unspecified product / location=Mono_scaffold00033:148398-148637(-) / protein_length=80 / sequence_SO=supercontig / SO=protein_coding / is_pseudo=false
MVQKCLSGGGSERLSLVELKKEFIERFPNGATMLTASDAIDVVEACAGNNEGSEACSYTVDSDGAIRLIRKCGGKENFE